MNSLQEQPFQYKQLRSQSLSPYNDSNLIKLLKRQLHYPPQKITQLASFEYVQNIVQDEINVVSSDCIQHNQKMTKERKSPSIGDSEQNTLKQEYAQSADVNQLKLIVPKLEVVKKMKQKIARKIKQKKNPVNPQDCNDDDILHQTIVIQQQNFYYFSLNDIVIKRRCNLKKPKKSVINQKFIKSNVQTNNIQLQNESKKENISILPQIKKQKLQIEEMTMKRSARIEQLMKKSLDDQFVELESLIKKMEKQPINKKEKRVSFLL